MSVMTLINSAVAWFAAAAVLSFVLSFNKSLSGFVAGVGGALGSLCAGLAGVQVLVHGFPVIGSLSLVHYSVLVSPLNAVWLIALGLCGLFVSLYNIDWHRPAGGCRLRDCGEQLRFAGGDGGNHGAVRRVPHRLCFLGQAVVCAGPSGYHSAGDCLPAAVAALRYAGSGAAERTCADAANRF